MLKSLCFCFLSTPSSWVTRCGVFTRMHTRTFPKGEGRNTMPVKNYKRCKNPMPEKTKEPREIYFRRYGWFRHFWGLSFLFAAFYRPVFCLRVFPCFFSVVCFLFYPGLLQTVSKRKFGNAFGRMNWGA